MVVENPVHTEQTIAQTLWRRLDAPGHDACRLIRSGTGWQLEGVAVLWEGGVPGRLDYQVECNADWVTTRGNVEGWIGERAVRYTIERTEDGVWSIDGVVVPGLDDCADLDLGFTPSTNLFQIRRIALTEGQSTEVPVAWLDSSTTALERLTQRYERRTEGTYWYESPRFQYAALLEVTPVGFVHHYPELWEMEPNVKSRDV